MVMFVKHFIIAEGAIRNTSRQVVVWCVRGSAFEEIKFFSLYGFIEIRHLGEKITRKCGG